MISSIEYAVSLIKNDFKHVLEFGVMHGTTIRMMRNKLPIHYKIYGFDSFEGLPEDWSGTVCKKDFLAHME